MKRRRRSLQPFLTALYSFEFEANFLPRTASTLDKCCLFYHCHSNNSRTKACPAPGLSASSVSASCAHAAGPLDPSQIRPAFCRSKRPFWTLTTIRRPPCGLSRICIQRPAGTYARLELRENASGFAGMLHRHSSLQASSLVVVSAWRFFPMPRCPLVSVHACDHSSLSRTTVL